MTASIDLAAVHYFFNEKPAWKLFNTRIRLPHGISISKERRIRLPKILGFPVPFVLVEDTRADQPWLGLCGLDSLVGLNAECGSLRVVAEYWTMRPTVPMAVCDRHALLSDSAIWLVAVNSWIEVWSELVWQTEINAP